PPGRPQFAGERRLSCRAPGAEPRMAGADRAGEHGALPTNAAAALARPRAAAPRPPPALVEARLCDDPHRHGGRAPPGLLHRWLLRVRRPQRLRRGGVALATVGPTAGPRRSRMPEHPKTPPPPPRDV